MARRMRGNSHVRCRAGEKAEITSNPYLSLLFGQNPREVAELFKEYLNKYHCFSKVIFAIPNGKNDKNLSVFKDIFN